MMAGETAPWRGGKVKFSSPVHCRPSVVKFHTKEREDTAKTAIILAKTHNLRVGLDLGT